MLRLTTGLSFALLHPQVSVRSPCCKKWFDCPECHAESESHELTKTTEMIFGCKKCKKVFRKDMAYVCASWVRVCVSAESYHANSHSGRVGPTKRQMNSARGATTTTSSQQRRLRWLSAFRAMRSTSCPGVMFVLRWLTLTNLSSHGVDQDVPRRPRPGSPKANGGRAVLIGNRDSPIVIVSPGGASSMVYIM